MAEQIASAVLSTAPNSRTGSRLTLKELRHVWLLDQTLNFNRAGELAGITQSALSQSIANIEERLGVKLFNRNRRAVSPTVFARLIAKQAESVLNSLDEMGSHIDALREARAGSIAFGMGIFASNHLLNPVMAWFHRRFPEINVRTTVDVPGVLQDLLLRGDIDWFVAARDAQYRDTGPNRELLYRDRLTVACRPGHPLISRGPVIARELIRYPTISPDGKYIKRQIYPLLSDTDDFELLERNIPAVTTQQPWLLVDFAEVSDHVIIASRSALQHWLQAGRLVMIEIDDLDMVLDIELVVRPGGSLSHGNERMVEVVREVVANQQLTVS